MNKETKFRIMLREKLVDTGYCEVTQWRNFSDAIELLITRSNDKDIISYYKGKKGKEIVDADKLLITTAQNNYNKGKEDALKGFQSQQKIGREKTDTMSDGSAEHKNLLEVGCDRNNGSSADNNTKKEQLQDKCKLELRDKSDTDGELFYGDAFEILKKYLDLGLRQGEQIGRHAERVSALMVRDKAIKKVLEIHKNLSDKISSWAEYDKSFIEELTKSSEGKDGN